ncbi:MAG: bifunctional 4-hydroxy-2-oxoglutarate aldolase/2-dehydro-3-deoxy-phosphogluconate aldolase [Clostridiales bacterium]|nr:bifunctional 4-hydroxy-2-oxoglutarate aldolase/2-dehydro-3-deoxy-phosphogluconate aldolase [Clostridiales bacterium]
MTTMDWINRDKIIAIVRGLDPEPMAKLAEALLAGGITLMEVTFNQARPETWKDTARSIRTIRERFAGRMLAGAGTVMSPEQLGLAADAGAEYIISPHADEAVIRETRARGLVSLPGALTPTEIAAAWRAGANAVKLFPAGDLGPAYVKAVRAPLSHIPLLAVGGITETNCAQFLSAGCSGVGVGGNLVNKQWIENGEFDRITALAKEFVRAAGR